MPVGALLMSRHVYDGVFDSLEHSVSHGSTFAPNDLAMAAGLATLARAGRRASWSSGPASLGGALARADAIARRVARRGASDVRGLGLMWAMEFGEPESGSLAWRVMERMQAGLFAQLVVVPLFTKHRILSQVAGHDLPVLKGLPPLGRLGAGRRGLRRALDDVIAKADARHGSPASPSERRELARGR